MLPLRTISRQSELIDVPPALSPSINQLGGTLRLHPGAVLQLPVIHQARQLHLEFNIRIDPQDAYAILLERGLAPHVALQSIIRAVNENVYTANADARRLEHNPKYLLRHHLYPVSPRLPNVDVARELPGPINWKYLPRPQVRTLIEAALEKTNQPATPPATEIDVADVVLS
jgi:hypothetical protein